MVSRQDDRGSEIRTRIDMMKNSIVTITDNALQRAKSLLNNDSELIGLRISVAQGGCSGMTYEVALSKEIKEGDEVVNKDGIKFIIDPGAIMFLLGSTIDWKEEKFKQGFTFQNPNETARCGCGESFSTS
ncbi:MAG: Iron-sulfur cluster insertion protein ErpA [Alphaproteobacteria bacterium MarineAlpha9_Bin4]|nr:MAG: Iron-sulfur cluster insertion protein ErpA [Alphaproteobacteria bacterium MarineAlpha9_Bin4]